MWPVGGSVGASVAIGPCGGNKSLSLRQREREREREQGGLWVVVLAHRWPLGRVVAIGCCLWPRGSANVQSLQWIDRVSMNLGEVVGGSSLFSIGFGGVATAGWSSVTEHVGVAVSCSHRPL
jgi:hypothetical protein